MTLDDLEKTLCDAIATDKIGTPVSLRLYLQLSDENANLFGAMATVMKTIKPVFSSQPSRLMARQHDSQNQLSILLDYEEGQTVSLTLGRGCAKEPSLNLLLVGNHGIVQLDGEELFEPPVEFSATAAENDWSKSIEECLATNTAVSLR